MNDNCSQCGTRRYIDPPLPGKISRITCRQCGDDNYYVWCQRHDKICVWSDSEECLPSTKSAFEHVYTKSESKVKPITKKELLVKLIEKIDTLERSFSERFNRMDKKFEDLENMIKYLPGSEIYNSAKTEFENLGKS